LGFGILYAWEIWAESDKPSLYQASGKIVIHYIRRYEKDELQGSTARKTHLAVLESPTLHRRTAERVAMAHPDLTPVHLDIHFYLSHGSNIMDVTGTASDPRYVQAYINELLSEYMATRRKVQDSITTQQGQMIQHLLLAQRDVADARLALEALHTSTPHGGGTAKAELEEALAEAKERYQFWKDLVGIYYSDGCSCSDLVSILELSGPATPVENKLDPRSVIMRHPWRAVASFGVAALLSLGLIPARRRP
jgi:hypothetical protein